MIARGSGIYSITNTVNGKQYIGSSVDMKNRRRAHLNCLRKGIHKNPMLQAGFNKYGEDAFSFNTLIICHEDGLAYYEKRMISFLHPAYNWIDVDDNFRWKFPDELKKKVSEAKRGMVFSAEHRKHMSEAAIKRLGRICTRQKKMKQLKLPKPHAPRVVSKYPPSTKGCKRPKEIGQKISASKMGYKYSEKARENLIRSHSKIPDDVIRSIRKSVRDGINYGVIHEQYGVPPATISRIVNGRCYGWVQG
jgi:group I intron endonuclease